MIPPFGSKDMNILSCAIIYVVMYKTTENTTTQPEQTKAKCTAKESSTNCTKICPNSKTKCNMPCHQKTNAINTEVKETKTVVPKQ